MTVKESGYFGYFSLSCPYIPVLRESRGPRILETSELPLAGRIRPELLELVHAGEQQKQVTVVMKTHTTKNIKCKLLL